MDRAEKLSYEKGMEEYFHEHKVYDLFEKLFEELIVTKPEKPIDYLIQRLKRKTTKRIFVTGYSGTNSKNICMALANALGYKCVNTTGLVEAEISKNSENSQKIKKLFRENRLIDDEIVIDLIKKQIIKYEEENFSYIIEGFPRNQTQSIFLQSMGVLPDNVILLTTNKENTENAIFEKIKEQMSNDEKGKKLSDEEIKTLAIASANETEMNIKALERVFRGFYDEVNVDEFEDQNQIVDRLAALFSFKEKVNASRNPPRIILVAPPSFYKDKISELVANQLKVINVNTMDLLRKEIGAKNENSKNILFSLEQNQLVKDKYILKLLEDRLYCSDCMINGWIVTGFPKSELQINYMEKMNSEIKPSLIVVIETQQEKIFEKAKKIKYDPKTGKNYSEDSNEYNKLVNNIVQRLTKRKQDGEEVLKKRIDEWMAVTENLINRGFKNLIKLDGNESESKLAELIVESVGFNS